MNSSVEPVVWRVHLAGAFDVNNADQLAEALRPGELVDTAIIDLRNVPYLDSTALMRLVRLRDRMLANGRDGTIQLCNVSRTLYRVFAVTGLTGVFHIQTSADPQP